MFLYPYDTYHNTVLSYRTKGTLPPLVFKNFNLKFLKVDKLGMVVSDSY